MAAAAAVALAPASPEPRSRRPAAKLAAPQSFEDVVALIDAARDIGLRLDVEKYVRPISFRPGAIEFEPVAGAPANLAQRLSARLKEWTGQPWLVAAQGGGGAETLLERQNRDLAAAHAERHGRTVRPGGVGDLPRGRDPGGAPDRHRPPAGAEPDDERGLGKPDERSRIADETGPGHAAEAAGGPGASWPRQEVEGVSGGGLVRVTLRGTGDMARLAIDESLIQPGEGEIIADLVVAAHADAKRKLEATQAEMMREVAGPLAGLPGMPKL